MTFLKKYGKKLLGEATEEESKYILIFRDMFPPLVTEYDFIKHYSDMVSEDDRVIVMIKNGEFAEVTRDVLNLYCQYMKNVVLHVTNKDEEELILGVCEKIIMPNGGGTLLFGCTSDEITKYKNTRQLVSKKYPQVIVIDPISTSYDNNTVVNSQEALNSIEDADVMVKFIPNHLTDDEVKEVILKLQTAAAMME